MRLVEIECDRKATSYRPGARVRVNAWQTSATKFQLVGATSPQTLTPHWYGFHNAVLIGEIDPGREMEADRVLCEYANEDPADSASTSGIL